MPARSLVEDVFCVNGKDLEDLSQDDPDNFILEINVIISITSDDVSSNGELFRVTVCTPESLYALSRRFQPFFLSSGFIVVASYDWTVIKSMILNRFHGVVRESANDIIIEFSGYASYADYSTRHEA